jgi:divalent metal cation (Fe/Co/Zn/Cd) transporter
MDPQLFSFLIVLSFVWFLAYWVLGGVFFAVVAIARLGRVRKVRFSCLFTLLSLLLGISTAYGGMRLAEDAVVQCMEDAASPTELTVAVFGCGFAGVLGAFLLGAVLLVIGGFIIMALSKSNVKPWIVLQPEETEAEPAGEKEQTSKFF